MIREMGNKNKQNNCITQLSNVIDFKKLCSNARSKHVNMSKNLIIFHFLKNPPKVTRTRQKNSTVKN